MQRFADLLFTELQARGVMVDLLKPAAVCGRFRSSSPALNKWLGYCDKLMLFPRRLRRHLLDKRDAQPSDVIVHICDHSNASYVRALGGTQSLVTCHDLLAVRSARGEFPENPTGLFGRNLQRLILSGLDRSPHVVCVSEATRFDLLRLTRLPPPRVCVVPNGLNYSYRPMPAAEATIQFNALRARHRLPAGCKGNDRDRYILHVGGNQWYKNRVGVLRIYHRLVERMPDAPDLVMVGKPLPDTLRAWIHDKELQDRVCLIEEAGNESLRALYSRASLLLFPSLAEGFGWPILEAQACGCLVVTANRPPMPEVGGAGACYCNPKNYAAAADLLQRVLTSDVRRQQACREEGWANARRFSTDAMLRGYLDLYQQILSN